MSPATKQLIREVAERHGVNESAVLGRGGSRLLRPPRAEVSRTLKDRGYTISTIARLLKRDRHTIYNWLSLQ